MAGLLDIAPACEKVQVGDKSIAVYPLSAKGIALLLRRFPELRMMMSGREVPVEQLMAMGGDAVAAIIAAGCGHPGDEQAEAIAGSLGADAQADLLVPILRLTMPNGVGPFVEKLTALGGVFGDAPSSTAPASKSPKRSTNSSGSDTTKSTSGPAALAN